ncbi:MAG: sensor histidine kinase [Syntrophales bacterium]
MQAIYIQTGSEEKYLISGDAAFYRQFAEMNGYLNRKMEELTQVCDTAEKKILAVRIADLHNRYRALFEKAAKERNRTSFEYSAEKEKMISEIEQSCIKIANLSDLSRSEKLQASEIISGRVARVITVTEAAAVMLVVIISLLITRSINTPIRLLLEKTKTTAVGEFGKPLVVASPPEIKELADSFNNMCERLKELDQMKIDFINHLSHELRTPLTAIKEASSMLTEGLFAGIPDKQSELFNIINEECERLIKSVSRILDLSRMEAGMADFSFEEVDAGLIIHKNISKLFPIARRKNIEIIFDPPDNIPPVRADEEKIGQVIENLLGNALNFTPEGGRISICLSKDEEKGWLEVSITDTGCGIPQESLEEIFNKFKRVDDRKGTVRGTGLGLSIAKHIINAHGGSIWAESEPGKGSVFFFSLPLSR